MKTYLPVFALALTLLGCTTTDPNAQDTTVQLSLRTISMLPTMAEGAVLNVQIPKHVSADVYCRWCVVVYKRRDSNGVEQLNTHRVIGLAGDRVEYAFDPNGSFFSVNSVKLNQSDKESYTYAGSRGPVTVDKLLESSGGHKYFVLNEQKINLASFSHSFFASPGSEHFPVVLQTSCSLGPTSFSCEVPKNYVFVIGDNRTQSLYGLVPVDHIVGYVAEQVAN